MGWFSSENRMRDELAVREWGVASRNLARNEAREKARGIRHEAPEYDWLADKAEAAYKNLPPWRRP